MNNKAHTWNKRDDRAMTVKARQRYFILIILGIMMSMPAVSIYAAEQCEPWVARIVSIQGTVNTRPSDAARWSPAILNQTYCAGDIVHVGENSRAAIELSNETIIRLDQKTIIVLSEIEEKESSWLEVLKGTIHIITRVPKSLKIKTPYVNAFVEGTEFLIRVEDEQTLVSVIEGQVMVENDLGRLLLASGQSSMTRDGEAPVLRLDIRPNDAVHWSLYYPSLLDKQGAAPPDGSTTDATVWDLLVQADALLAVGRVEEAAQLLGQVLELIPDNSTAYAMLSIIALAQNEKDQALELANKALSFHPESVEALIGLSYGLQAHFELEGARLQIEKALRYEPENALLMARLAELRLSLGDLDQALVVARRSVELNPQQARSLTVLGFVYLGKFKVQGAKEIFARAITLDQADPLPRLGNGLALIREGDLKSGRREIEIAASLDPNNALVRSYLGKAYYEEHRSKLAADQFELSRSLDPLDPTPWFYDAIRKQSENRPVEALFDLQKSIELNDNRAVYRSRFLLDQDLASRSASLARIYNDLGFQQLALAEGWKSVNTDPGNHSAHRFLADSYAVLPRHEIARVSELLQSQLLQPVNLNPIQPQLTESNLGILDGAGPSEVAFNEFNPLFVRNRFALQLNGIAGGNDTWGNDAVQSGLWNNFSYSLGQFHYENDGFRENNDQLQDIYNIFAQSALNHKTSVQFEYRKSETDKGDLPLRFDPADFDDTFREQDDSEILRFGIHRQHTSRARTIVSALSRDLNIIQQMSTPFFTLENKNRQDGHIIEVWHQQESKTHTIITGAGSFRADSLLNVDILDTGITIFNTEDRIRHDNVYVYDQSDYFKDTHITLGLSWNTTKDELAEVDQLNPKFGLMWDV
ncbi:MAG TPA: FecR domain-containing protein, partial [Gammaproteobacteria bacterium]